MSENGRRLIFEIFRYNPQDPDSKPHMDTFEIEEVPYMSLFMATRRCVTASVSRYERPSSTLNAMSHWIGIRGKETASRDPAPVLLSSGRIKKLSVSVPITPM